MIHDMNNFKLHFSQSSVKIVEKTYNNNYLLHNIFCAFYSGTDSYSSTPLQTSGAVYLHVMYIWIVCYGIRRKIIMQYTYAVCALHLNDASYSTAYNPYVHYM